MKISIITAVFNNEKTVARSLLSIKEQNFENIELIIIDGNSSDKSVSIINEIVKQDDIFISEPDNGIYDALNKGLSYATGDIIAFLHADDLYSDPACISQVVKIFKKKNVDIVYGDAAYFKENKISKISRKYKSDKFSKRNLAWGKMPVHPSMFIKRSVYEKHGFFRTDLTIAGDYDFLCRIIDSNYATYYLPKTFVLMQLGGISTKRTLKNIILINKEIIIALRDNNIYSNIFMVLSRYFFKIQQLIKK
jgi:glycosyltransferase